MSLPINPKELLESNLIEKERLELKQGYNPIQVLHTLCAFANDFNNWGGGYIVIGVKDNKEVGGVKASEIDKIQKNLIQISNRIQPTYYPVIEPVKYQNKHIIILYCPGGSVRPYKAPKSLTKQSGYKYYIRHGTSSVVANNEEEKELISMSNQIPFDDRVNYKANLDDLEDDLIKRYLKDRKLDFEELSKEDICRNLNIAEGPNEFLKPKNVGLLMFSKQPKKFIKTPWIETTIFFDEIGDNFEEKVFEGNIIDQIKNSLDYIKTKVISERVQKIKGKAESLRYYSYPFEAVEEAAVNAIYHKSYEEDVPVEIRVELDRIDIISYPGPLPPLNKDNLNDSVVIAKKYRNRRIGEFLKEYDLTEQKNTGFRKIRNALKNNGSPEPEFITDEERTQFITRIKIHPEFKKKRVIQQVSDQVSDQVKILTFCKETKSIQEIMKFLGFKHRTYFRKNLLKPLLDKGLLVPTIPDKPKSSKQKYKTTKKGEDYLK